MSEQAHATTGTYLRIAAILVIITLIEVGVFYVPTFQPVLVPVEPLGFAPQRCDRARPPGRALCAFRRSQDDTTPGCKLCRSVARAFRRSQRPAAQPLRPVPLQRAHGAALAPHPAIPAAIALRDARLGGP